MNSKNKKGKLPLQNDPKSNVERPEKSKIPLDMEAWLENQEIKEKFKRGHD